MCETKLYYTRNKKAVESLQGLLFGSVPDWGGVRNETHREKLDGRKQRRRRDEQDERDERERRHSGGSIAHREKNALFYTPTLCCVCTNIIRERHTQTHTNSYTHSHDHGKVMDPSGEQENEYLRFLRGLRPPDDANIQAAIST